MKGTEKRQECSDPLKQAPKHSTVLKSLVKFPRARPRGTVRGAFTRAGSALPGRLPGQPLL